MTPAPRRVAWMGGEYMEVDEPEPKHCSGADIESPARPPAKQKPDFEAQLVGGIIAIVALAFLTVSELALFKILDKALGWKDNVWIASGVCVGWFLCVGACYALAVRFLFGRPRGAR